MLPRCSCSGTSKGTKFRTSPDFYTRPRELLPSRCFEHAAVSGNQFASFLEEADMDSDRHHSKLVLQAAIDTVRNSEPDAKEMEDASARVWTRIGRELTPSPTPPSLKGEALRSCDDFLALIPDFVTGRLSSARVLLFTDHTHECVACRNVLNAV